MSAYRLVLPFLALLLVTACDAVRVPGVDQAKEPDTPVTERSENAEVESAQSPQPESRTVVAAPVPSARSVTPSAAPNATSLADCLAAGEDDFTCIEIAYGTNRTPAEAGGGEQAVYGREFSGTPDCIGELDRTSDGVCHLGVAIVTINAPDERRRRVGTPFKSFDRVGRIPSARDRRNQMTIWRVGRFEDDPRAEMISYAQGIIAGLNPEDRHALVFIHGFNVPFEGSLYRAAQLKFDLDFAGPVFTFSWPSDGDPQRYLADQDDADVSVGALARYLRLVRRAVGQDSKIHIVAHSMGSRVTSQALARLEWEKEVHGDVGPFETTVLAGGDIDRVYFGQLLRAANEVPGEVTIYTSDSDKAVECSQAIRDLFAFRSRREDPKARLGLHSEEAGRAVSDDYETIDISAFGSKLGFRCTNSDHADYAQEPEVFWDLSCVLAGEPPSGNRRQRILRGPIFDAVSQGEYWRLEEGEVPQARTCRITGEGIAQ